jgi:periplasmic protein TonB
LPEDGTPPSPISKPSPPYPDSLKSEGVEGTVVVRFVVTESGDVSGVSIVRGHPRLDPIVMETVKTWKFKPAMVDGRAVATYQVARFNFKIKT